MTCSCVRKQKGQKLRTDAQRDMRWVAQVQIHLVLGMNRDDTTYSLDFHTFRGA